MKKSIGSLILFLLALTVLAQEPAITYLYVGTFTSEGAEGIYLCHFDETTGELTSHKVFKGINDPSFISISPNRQYLYAVTRAANELEAAGGYIQANRIEPDGSLAFINKQVSNGSGPCHVDVSPDEIGRAHV